MPAEEDSVAACKKPRRHRETEPDAEGEEAECNEPGSPGDQPCDRSSGAGRLDHPTGTGDVRVVACAGQHAAGQDDELALAALADHDSHRRPVRGCASRLLPRPGQDGDDREQRPDGGHGPRRRASVTRLHSPRRGCGGRRRSDDLVDGRDGRGRRARRPGEAGDRGAGSQCGGGEDRGEREELTPIRNSPLRGRGAAVFMCGVMWSCPLDAREGPRHRSAGRRGYPDRELLPLRLLEAFAGGGLAESWPSAEKGYPSAYPQFDRASL